MVQVHSTSRKVVPRYLVEVATTRVDWQRSRVLYHSRRVIVLIGGSLGTRGGIATVERLTSGFGGLSGGMYGRQCVCCVASVSHERTEGRRRACACQEGKINTERQSVRVLSTPDLVSGMVMGPLSNAAPCLLPCLRLPRRVAARMTSPQSDAHAIGFSIYPLVPSASRATLPSPRTIRGSPQ